jgi:hypothetical protein
MRSLALAALALAVLAGCEPKYPDFMAGRSDKVNRLKTRLGVVDDSIAAAGPVLPTAKCDSPPPALSRNSFAHPGNLEIHPQRTMAALSKGTEVPPATEKLDVMLQDLAGTEPGARTALQWAQHLPDNLKAQKILKPERDAIDSSLELGYVMVLAPRPVKDGAQPVDVYLSDLATGRLACSFTVLGKVDPPAPKVEAAAAEPVEKGKHHHHSKHDKKKKHGKHDKAVAAAPAPKPVYGTDIVASTKAAIIDALQTKLNLKM